MKEFSYYWDGNRQTRTDDAYLLKLTEGVENQADIIDGIKNSEESFKASLAEPKRILSD